MMMFLPPISRCTFLNDGAACSETVRPTLGRSGKRDDAHVGVLRERVADLLAAAGDEIDDARRDARLLEDLHEIDRRERRQRRRLEHDRVAADQRGNDFPRRDRHRKIPRRDDRADAQRLADRHRELVAQLGRDGLAVLPPPFTRDEEGHVDRFLHVAARLVEHLSHLARHVAGERLLAVGNQLRGAEQDLRASRRGHQTPVLDRPGAPRRSPPRRRLPWTSGTGRSHRRRLAGLRFSNSCPATEGTQEPSIKLW